jgi:hypothetical protein
VNDLRVKKNVDSAVENYYLDGDNIAFVTDGVGDRTFHYLYGLADGGTSHLKALRINGYKIKERKRWVIDSTKHPYPPHVSKRISQSVRK